MKCVPISGLKLDKRSAQGIKRIQEVSKLSEVMVKALGYCSFVNIFLGNKVPEIAFNIYQSDWKTLQQSMSSLAPIQRRMIEDEARYQVLDHYGDSKQRVFWEGIVDGCKIN